jgi:hypothetical protein
MPLLIAFTKSKVPKRKFLLLISAKLQKSGSIHAAVGCLDYQSKVTGIQLRLDCSKNSGHNSLLCSRSSGSLRRSRSGTWLLGSSTDSTFVDRRGGHRLRTTRRRRILYCRSDLLCLPYSQVSLAIVTSQWASVRPVQLVSLSWWLSLGPWGLKRASINKYVTSRGYIN